MKRFLIVIVVAVVLVGCAGGGGNTPPTAAVPTGSAATTGGGPTVLVPTARSVSGSPTAPGVGLPPLPTNTLTATTRPGGTPGTPVVATPGTPGTPRALPSAPPVAFLPPPWKPGDRTIYNVSARDTGQLVGTASYTLGREFEADTISALLNVGSTQDRFVMGINNATLAPVSELRSIVTAQGTLDIRAEFHEGGCTIEVIDRTGTQVKRLNLPPKYYANDQLLVILRALPFKEGYQGSLIIVPAQGEPSTLQAVVTVTGQESVTTPLGPVRSWRVEAQFEGNPTIQLLWYAVDSPNYLVKYDTGRVIYTVAQRP